MERFGLIGKDLEYTQAQRIHSEIGDYEYTLIETEDTEKLRIILGDQRFDGFNITHPYRYDVIGMLDELSEDAARSRSVNVVKRLPDGRLKGLNTDMEGFRWLVNDSVSGKLCLVLGTGGAARSAAEVLREMGAGRIVLVSRDPEEASRRLEGRYEVTGYNRLYPYYDAEVIVNCTPVGKFPDVEISPFSEPRISVRLFTRLELAIDLIYNPYRTKFLQDAKRLTHCQTKSGLDMVIIQAVASQNVWYDKTTDIEEEERIIRCVKRKILESQLNVISVGMPGSGKTTIFRRYAYELGLKFIDLDEETEKLMGASIEDVLDDTGKGIEYFREKEHEAVRAACCSRGCVIATGAETLTNPVNRDILRSNGIVIYVKRPLEMLSLKGHPLGVDLDIGDIFHDRDYVFRRIADIVLVNSRIFGEKREKTGEGNSYNYELKGFVYSLARKVQKHLNELAANIWI